MKNDAQAPSEARTTPTTRETRTAKGKEGARASRRLVSAGVWIALYFVVFVIFGSVCMPIPPRSTS